MNTIFSNQRNLMLLAWLVVFAATTPGANPALGENYAFLVAVGDYDPTQVRPLQYTRNDIIEFQKLLLASDFAPENVVVMHDDLKLLVQEGKGRRYVAECAKIKKEFALLLDGLTADDSLIVGLAGHGVQFRGEKQSYFCPADARLDDRETLISMSAMYGQLQKCRAGRKLLIVDACRNDPLSAVDRGRAKVDLQSSNRPSTELPEGIVALYSCSATERSIEDPKLEHGLFFYSILEGWKGAAGDRDGRMTLDDLRTYAKKNTQTLARLNFNVVQRPEELGRFSGEWVLRSEPAPIEFLSHKCADYGGVVTNPSDGGVYEGTLMRKRGVLKPGYAIGAVNLDAENAPADAPHIAIFRAEVLEVGKEEIRQEAGPPLWPVRWRVAPETAAKIPSGKQLYLSQPVSVPDAALRRIPLWAPATRIDESGDRRSAAFKARWNTEQGIQMFEIGRALDAWAHHDPLQDRSGFSPEMARAIRSRPRPNKDGAGQPPPNTEPAFPPAIVYGPDGKPWHSWRVLILAFLGEEGRALASEYRFDQPWDSPANQRLSQRMPRVYRDPADKNAESVETPYVALVGEQAAFTTLTLGKDEVADAWPHYGGRRLNTDFPDGRSNTILLASRPAGRRVPWMKPEDIRFNPDAPAARGAEPCFVVNQNILGPFMMVDGHIDMLRPDLSWSHLRALITPAGGESMPPEVDPFMPINRQVQLRFARGPQGATTEVTSWLLDP